MPNDRQDKNEFPLKVRQVLILTAVILAFAVVIRLASGDPLPHDLRDFLASMLNLKHG
jgi:hypothetical protein